MKMIEIKTVKIEPNGNLSKEARLSFKSKIEGWAYETFLRTGVFPEHRNIHDYLKEIGGR